MKIALVHELFIKMGGAEKVVEKLAEMYPKSPLYTLVKDEKKFEPWLKQRQVITSPLQKIFDRLNHPKWLLGKMPKAIESFDFSEFDAVISSSSAFAHGLKTNKEVKHICYCHSPMRYAWDYTHQYTQGMSFPMQLGVARLLNEIRVWDFESSNRPDVMIANSQHVQKRISKYYRRASDVIYPPVKIKDFKATKDHDDYFLIVSALTPFKRIDLAIEAFNKLGRHLVIIGDGSQRKILESMAKDNIEFLGRRSDEEVVEYMQNCRAFIFPGEEDFGMTPVEAMAAGKPVLAYGAGGVLESVIEGETGEFFSELTPQSLTQGLTRLLLNEENYDHKKIRQQVEKFDEAIFEEKMRKVVKGI